MIARMSKKEKVACDIELDIGIRDFVLFTLLIESLFHLLIFNSCSK